MKRALFLLIIFFVAFAGVPLGVLAAEEKILSLDLDSKEIISMEALRGLQIKKKSFVLFDARGIESFRAGHIDGAALPFPQIYYQEKQMLASGVISKPFDFEQSLAEGMKGFPKNTVIVTYCNSNCKASTNLLRHLQQLGFSDVRSMEEGYQSWEKAGYPVAKNMDLSGIEPLASSLRTRRSTS